MAPEPRCLFGPPVVLLGPLVDPLVRTLVDPLVRPLVYPLVRPLVDPLVRPLGALASPGVLAAISAR